MKETLIVACIIIGFPLFWITVLYLIGFLGGWQSLANNYPSRTFKGKELDSFSFCSLRLSSLGRYNNAVTIKVFKEGIEICPF